MDRILWLCVVDWYNIEIYREVLVNICVYVYVKNIMFIVIERKYFVNNE